MATRPKEGSGAETEVAAAQAGEARGPAPAVPVPVTPAAGVVIRVLISGAHASFLHMRVFPSTTAGQVREGRAQGKGLPLCISQGS